jgi:hypothetical protein
MLENRWCRLLASGLAGALFLLALNGGADEVRYRPVIDGDWWQVAGDPELGPYTSPGQQPVDFGIWQAADGTWQIWSCIRHTKCGGKTRLFHGWEGKRITDRHWQPMGIAMEADPAFGETPGGLQAPHVIRWQDKYWMFYGDWQNICLAVSDDGKRFRRVVGDDGRAALFSGPYGNTRDPMVLQVDDRFYCYYTGHVAKDSPEKHKGAVFCRTSRDLRSWNEPVKVSAGGSPATQSNWYGGDCECPFVVRRDGSFCLFRNQRYGTDNANTQYCSRDPLNFGVDDDRCLIGTLPVAAPEIVLHEGQYYIAALMPTLKGLRIAKLKWERVSGR